MIGQLNFGNLITAPRQQGDEAVWIMVNIVVRERHSCELGNIWSCLSQKQVNKAKWWIRIKDKLDVKCYANNMKELLLLYLKL